MYRHFGNTGYRNASAPLERDAVNVAQSGQLDALLALERIGTRLSFSRNDEIYGEGDTSDCGTRSSPIRFASASFSPTAGVTLPSSVSAATALASMVSTNAHIRPKRWIMPSSCATGGARPNS